MFLNKMFLNKNIYIALIVIYIDWLQISLTETQNNPRVLEKRQGPYSEKVATLVWPLLENLLYAHKN